MAVTTNKVIKSILMLLILYKASVFAEQKLDTRTNFHWKLCSIFKWSDFCLPYIYGAYSYPVFPISGPILPIAPFPLIINPTSQAPSYTIPTVFTTTARPSMPFQPQVPFLSTGPIVSIPMIPNQSSTPCPPTISVCPPTALAAPIDPRQGISSFVFFFVNEKNAKTNESNRQYSPELHLKRSFSTIQRLSMHGSACIKLFTFNKRFPVTIFIGRTLVSFVGSRSTKHRRRCTISNKLHRTRAGNVSNGTTSIPQIYSCHSSVK